jgi:hypothetical protein
VSTVAHKGFHIIARPYQLHATGLWTVEVEIRRKGRLRAFSAVARYATEAEATAQSLDFGRRIVSGQVPGCSIDSLRSA